jgi:c-di-GMP-binding flagellar brake protein YcgR
MIELKADTLFEAIRDNVDIELRSDKPDRKETEDVLFFSKFLAFDANRKIVIIDFPSASSVLHVISENDPVMVKYIHKESPFVFHSKVLGITALSKPGQEKRQVMLMSLPLTVKANERRSFLKLSTPPFDIEIKVIRSNDIIKQIKDKKYHAVVLNISGGGIAFKRKGEELPFSEGDVLELKVDLPNKKIHIEAELLNVYESESTGEKSFGLKYIILNLDKLNYNRCVRAVIRYVVRRERELLSRR